MNTTAKPSAIESYIVFYFAARNALIDAIATFKQQALFGATIAEQAEAASAALEAQQDLSLLKVQHATFMAGKGPIKPPSKAIVDEAVRLAREMAEGLWKTRKISDAVAALDKVATAVATYQRENRTTSVV